MKDSAVKKKTQYSKIAEMSYEIHINWSYAVRWPFPFAVYFLTFI